MRGLRLLPAALLAMTLLAGCGFDKTYTAVDPTVWTPKPKGYDVPVLREIPDRAHKVLGELTVSRQIKPSFELTSSVDQAEEEMKREARKRGADAVINFQAAEEAMDDGHHSRLVTTGTLVVFTAPPPMAAR